MVVNVLDVRTVRDETTEFLGFLIFFTGELGEAPLVRNDNLWRPGNLYLQRRRASMTVALLASLVRTEIKTWPMSTRATVPTGLPKAPRIPVCKRSAPAQLNILLIRKTWKDGHEHAYGSYPYRQPCWYNLLAAIWAASKLHWKFVHVHQRPSGHRAEFVTASLLRPKSKIRIWGQGHRGRNGTWGKAYSYNNDSSEQDGDPSMCRM